MRVELDITAGYRTPFDSSAFTLELGIFDDEIKPTIALVRRVHLGGGQGITTSPAVVKFSEGQHAISKAPCVQLSVPQVYRDRQDLPRGIRDPLDAAYLERYDYDRFLDIYGRPAPRIRTPSASVTLTRAVHGCWLFCTSIQPADDEQMTALAQRFPDYDCATMIDDPSEFAVQLGLDFGRLVRHEVVHLDTLVQLVRQRTRPLGLSVVNVYHGPVFYPSDPAAFLNQYPDELRGQVLPFVKNKEFEEDQEYRFAVSVFGIPSSQIVRFPTSNEIRALGKLAGGAQTS